MMVAIEGELLRSRAFVEATSDVIARALCGSLVSGWLEESNRERQRLIFYSWVFDRKSSDININDLIKEIAPIPLPAPCGAEIVAGIVRAWLQMPGRSFGTVPLDQWNYRRGYVIRSRDTWQPVRKESGYLILLAIEPCWVRADIAAQPPPFTEYRLRTLPADSGAVRLPGDHAGGEGC